MTMQANLTNRDATRVPHPYVKWSYEPPRAADVPAAIGRAIHTAALAPKGPAFVSIPMDDWTEEAAEDGSRQAIARSIDGRSAPAPDAIAALAARIANATNPVLVAGPDIDASGGWENAVSFAESQRLPVWSIPATGGGRLGFPEGHPQFQGVLPPAIAPISETLAAHDLILVVGASVFAYYPYLPGDLLPEGAELVQITSDPEEAARAPMGEAIVADPALTLGALNAAIDPSSREAPPEREGPMDPPELEEGSAISGTEAMAALGAAFPDDGIIVLESPSSTMALRNQLRISRPGSYYFGAGGGLGFGLSAAVGVQLAQPDRPVVCVIGEGSVQYAVTAFWSAVAYDAPVTFLVLRNDEYAILKWFSAIEGVEGAPGLDLPKLDTASIASAYGVGTVKVRTADELREALAGAVAAKRPELVEVGVAAGMWLF
jgi:benzoylformate decarboxylase